MILAVGVGVPDERGMLELVAEDGARFRFPLDRALARQSMTCVGEPPDLEEMACGASSRTASA